MPLFARLARTPGGLFGLIVLGAVLVLSAVAPLIYPESPWRVIGPALARPFQIPGLPLGTDMLGRDIAAQIAHGARTSLLVAIASTLVACLIGTVLGAVAGYCGGLVEGVLLRLTEFFQTLPGFVLAVCLVALFQPSVYSTVAAIALVSWPPLVRIVRGEVMSLKQREFVQASVTLGQSGFDIVWSEILPNTLSPIIVTGSLMIASAILIESSISFLGLGDPTLMSWGFIIGAGRSMVRTAWWIGFFPGAAILATALAMNLIGEALNDALNPHLASRGRA